MREFIKKNREAIDKYKGKCPNIKHLSDEDRRQWILNDESLYLWAIDENAITA